jgi:hypothetical protein
VNQWTADRRRDNFNRIHSRGIAVSERFLVEQVLDGLMTLACGGTAAGDCHVAKTNGLVPTLSLLRRAHDYRRDLWAMAATTRAAARAHTNCGQHVMTWLGLRSPHTATPKLRRMLPGTPFATIGATGLDRTRGQPPMNGLPGEKSRSPSPRQRQSRAGSGMTSTKQNSKAP